MNGLKLETGFNTREQVVSCLTFTHCGLYSRTGLGISESSSSTIMWTERASSMKRNFTEGSSHAGSGKTFWKTRNSESEWLITDQSDGIGIIAQPFSWCCECHIMMPGYPDEHLLKRNCASFGLPHHHADLCRLRQELMLVSIFLQLVYHRQQLITDTEWRSVLCSVAPKSAELSKCSWSYIAW